ncbi:MAG: hypothetical protein ACTSPB_26860, partial [Candidatus Thorarchaeota archaeon]
MKTTRSPVARLMIVVATLLLIFSLPSQANTYRAATAARGQKVIRVRKPTRRPVVTQRNITVIAIQISKSAITDGVKSSKVEEAIPLFKRFELITIPVAFQTTGPRFSLVQAAVRASAVKAQEEETPAEPEPKPEAKPEPQVVENPPPAEAFILTDDDEISEQPSDPQNNGLYSAPQTEIAGADTDYQIGDLIELWVKPLTTEPEDLHSVNYTWTILPIVPLKVWPDNTRVLFGTGPESTTYVVLLNAAYVFSE